MPLDTNCPKCGAPHAKKLSVVYSEGISTVQISSQSLSATNTIGKIEISTSGNSTGIQQTEHSRSAAPPPPILSLIDIQKMNVAQLRTAIFFIGFCCSLALPFLIKFFFKADPGFFSTIFIGLLITVAVGALYKPPGPGEAEQIAHQTRVEERQKEIDNWNITFACTQCGTRFIPRESEQRQVRH